jgi:hypothetical protein
VEVLGYGFCNGTPRGMVPLFLPSKVGIGAGMSNPQYQLEVNGSINAGTALYEASNSLITRYTLSNTFSNAQSNFAAYSNYITPKLIWTSNTLSNFSTDSNGDQSITIINNTSCNIVQQVTGKSSAGGDFLKWLFSSIGSAVVSTTITLAANNLSIGEKTIMEWGAEGFKMLQNSLTGAVMNASSNLLQGFKTFRTVGGKDFLTVSPEEKVSLLADYAKWGTSSVTINGDSNTIIITDSNTNSNVYLGLDKCYMMSNVGIGLSNPTYKLQVIGDIYSASNIYEGGYMLNTRYAPSNAQSNWNYGSNTSFWCSNNTSNLPILYANSNAQSNWNFGSNTSMWCSNNTSNLPILYANSNAQSNWNFGSNTSAWCSNNIASLSTSNHTHADKYVSSVSNNTIYTLSNMGIGTSNPTALLHVQGVNGTIVNSYSGGSLLNGAPLQYILRADSFDIYPTSNQVYGGIALRSYNTTGTGIYGIPDRCLTGLSFITRNGTSSNVEAMNIKHDGSVGIGYSNPSYKLQVNGTASATTLMEGTSNLITKYSLSNHNHDAAYAPSNHNHDAVYAPSNHSHSDRLWAVASQSNIYTLSNVAVCATSESTNATLYVCSPYAGDPNSPKKCALISEGLGGWSKSKLHFCLENSYSTSTSASLSHSCMVIQPDGCVGVGTTSPTYKFEVKTAENNFGFAHTTPNVSLLSWINNANYIPAQIGTYTNHNLGFYVNNGSPSLTLLTNGNCGVGYSNPTYKLDVAGNMRNKYSHTILQASYGIYLTTTSDQTYWRINHDYPAESDDNIGNLNFILSESGTEYNMCYIEDDNGVTKRLNFTGCHRVKANNSINPDTDEGLIVCATGKYSSLLPEIKTEQIDNITISEALPKVALCKKKKDARVFGVVVGNEELTKEGSRKFAAGSFVTCVRKVAGDDRIECNALGEGAVWVCDANGSFSNGDFITTSDVAGYGERQDDDLVHNYTLGKITCDVDWTDKQLDKMFQTRVVDGHLCAFVGCIYML